MTACELLNLIRADGSSLTLTSAGKLRITGTHAERWLPILSQYEADLVDALQADPDKEERR